MINLKDRNPSTPGRITLKNVATGEITTFVLADNPTEEGTPINKATLEALAEDILDQTKSSLHIVDTKNLDTTHIKGKLVVNPAYDTETNLYNEGIRVNKASNGWSNIEVGGENDSAVGTSSDLWIIARRGEDGPKSGKVGDLTIECNSSGGYGLTLYKNGSAPTWQNKKVLLKEDTFTLSGTTLTIKL